MHFVNHEWPYMQNPKLAGPNGKAYIKVFWSSQNGSFVFDQIFVYGTLMGVDYKSEKKI